MRTATQQKRLEKEQRQKAAAISRGERMHIKGVTVWFVGMVGQLHGSECSCCPKRDAA